jgi:hypothetical protein
MLSLAASTRVCPSVLQQPPLLQNVFVIQKPMLPGKWVCSLAVYAVSGRVWSLHTAALPPLDVAALQQPVLPLDVCLFSGSLCCTWTCLCVCSTVQQSVLSKEVSGLRQLVLHLDVSVQQRPVLCPEVYGPQYSSLYCTWSVRLQELLCSTWTCLSTRASVALVRVCLQELCAAPERVCLQEPVLYLCVCLSTRAFVLHLDLFVYNSLGCSASFRVFLQDLIQCCTCRT